jgi:hypothetical protein
MIQARLSEEYAHRGTYCHELYVKLYPASRNLLFLSEKIPCGNQCVTYIFGRKGKVVSDETCLRRSDAYSKRIFSNSAA